MDKIRHSKQLGARKKESKREREKGNKELVTKRGEGSSTDESEDRTPRYMNRLRDQNAKTAMDEHHNYFFSKGPPNVLKPKQKTDEVVRTLKQRVKLSEKEAPLVTETDLPDAGDVSDKVLDQLRSGSVNKESSSLKDVPGYGRSDLDAEERLRQYKQRKELIQDEKNLDKQLSDRVGDLESAMGFKSVTELRLLGDIDELGGGLNSERRLGAVARTPVLN